jgi:hypothetical protein
MFGDSAVSRAGPRLFPIPIYRIGGKVQLDVTMSVHFTVDEAGTVGPCCNPLPRTAFPTERGDSSRSTVDRDPTSVKYATLRHWGVNSEQQTEPAFSFMTKHLNVQGKLLVGWNSDRCTDPMTLSCVRDRFQYAALISTFTHVTFSTSTHCYDVLELRQEAAHHGSKAPSK